MKNLQAKLGAWAGVLLMLLLLIPVTQTTGCSKAQVTSLVTTLGSASANLATILGNPTVAAQITADTQAAITAINNWQGTSSLAGIAIQAINVLQSDISLIPGLSSDPTVLALVTLALGTLSAILSLIPNSLISPNAEVRQYAHINSAPKNKKDFSANWNAIVNSSNNANLAAAKI